MMFTGYVSEHHCTAATVFTVYIHMHIARNCDVLIVVLLVLKFG